MLRGSRMQADLQKGLWGAIKPTQILLIMGVGGFCQQY